MQPVARRRVVAFCSIAALLNAMSVYGHVVDNPSIGWRMFHSRGSELCEVIYEQRSADGSATRIDRYAALLEDTTALPRGYGKIHGLEEAEALGQRLCASLGPGADVGMRMRCGSTTTWRKLEDGERNLCAEAGGARRSAS